MVTWMIYKNFQILQVAGGQIIGKATMSTCAGNNHIHMTMMKPDGIIDPTRFLEPRFPMIPKWIQQCDDYRLVYKVTGLFVIGLSTR